MDAQSAAWDDNGVLVYTTLNHVKYCLPNGDSGTIRTLDVPVYITKVANQTLYVLDRDGKNRQIQVRTGDVHAIWSVTRANTGWQACGFGARKPKSTWANIVVNVVMLSV